jgi:hypothetical protein
MTWPRSLGEQQLAITEVLAAMTGASVAPNASIDKHKNMKPHSVARGTEK